MTEGAPVCVLCDAASEGLAIGPTLPNGDRLVAPACEEHGPDVFDTMRRQARDTWADHNRRQLQ